MKFSTLLNTPWRVTHRSQGWLMAAIFALCGAGAVAIGHFADNRHWWIFSTMLYCAGIALFWAIQMPHLLLVSIDARRLRAPGIPQTAAQSVIIYAVLCIALPVLVLAPLGANAAAVALAVALTITSGLAFALLARHALLIGYVLFFVAQGAVRLLHIPLPGHPDHATVAAWGTFALAVLLVLDISRWRTLARGDSSSQTGIRSPMVMQFARDGTFGLTSRASRGDGRRIRQIPEWLQGRADLRDADPAHPVRAIRIALGRRIMPLTLQSRFRQWAVAGAWLAFVLIVLLGEGSVHGAHSLFRSSWFWMTIGGIFAVTVPSTRITAVQSRWSGSSAELSLLALLPGLGTRAEQKRHALHAILLQPLSWLLGALLACWILVTAVHAPFFVDVYALVAVLGSATLLWASVLGSLGGKPLGSFAVGSLLVALLILVGVTPNMDSLPRVFLLESASAVPRTEVFFAACWLVWLVVVGLLVLSGWRSLQRRPHPFLANDR